MPTGVNLTINDGLATPVARTFELLSAASGYNGVAEWVYKKGNFSIGWPTFTFLANKSKGKRKASGKLVYPVVTTDAQDSPLYSAGAICHFDVTFDTNFPEDQKADVIAFMTNIMTNALIKGATKDATPVT